MAAHPWGHHTRDQLRPGMSYPVGRDVIEHELREAGAEILSLTFSVPMPGMWQEDGPRIVVRVDWLGDARSGYISPVLFEGADRLSMYVYAVPSSLRREVGSLLVPVLGGACRWAAEALRHGNAWTSSSHEWVASYVRGSFRVQEH